MRQEKGTKLFSNSTDHLTTYISCHSCVEIYIYRQACIFIYYAYLKNGSITPLFYVLFWVKYLYIQDYLDLLFKMLCIFNIQCILLKQSLFTRPSYILKITKTIYMNIFTNQKQTHRLREWTFGSCRMRCRGETARECGTSTYTVLYSKCISNTDLLFITGRSAQWSATA